MIFSLAKTPRFIIDGYVDTIKPQKRRKRIMLKAILKTVGIALGLVAIPIALIIIGMALSIVGPLVGILLIIFLPLVIAGVIIGYNSAKKDKGA